MAGKKSETDKKDVVGTFPQMSSKCHIKQVTLKKGGQDIRFEGFSVSENQTAELDSLINTGEDIMVTISVVQGRFPETEQ